MAPARTPFCNCNLYIFILLFLKRDAVLGEIMFEGLFQPMHLMVIAGIALLIFGPKKLPELGKGLGESIRGFKAAMAAKEEVPAIAVTADGAKPNTSSPAK
jgi:sec-independent protein translocase protein TatA